MKENLSVQITGISFASLLFIVFLILKLVGVITWTWLWVTAPLWIPIGLVIIILLILLIISIILKYCE